jgi:D-3-phosphoglycerate dehydrogenase
VQFKVVVTMTLPQHHFDVPYEEQVLGAIGAEVIKYERCATEESVIAACHDADAVLNVFEPFSRRVIENLSKCKIISKLGTGLDGTDLEAATEHGIVLTNLPEWCNEEVSDQAMTLLLACSRKIIKMNQIARTPGLAWWSKEARKPLEPMFALRTQTLGLVGFGRIARTLVPKAKGFGLKLLAFDPYLKRSDIEEYGVEPVEFNQLLEESDFVSIHVPLTAENRHLFGAEAFKRMKPTAYLINASRGAVVDEQALYTAISEGWIAGAGLDVMEKEQPPDPDNPLFKLENVIITPHNGSYSEESFWDLRRTPVDEVARVLQGKWPVYFANPEVKENFVQRWGLDMA